MTVPAHSGPDTPSDPDLFLLAMDHRASLASQVYHLTGDPTPVDAERIAAGKLMIFQGLLAALDGTYQAGKTPYGRADRACAGVLVDERYGAEVARQAKAAGLRLAMPAERSGQAWFTLEYGTIDERVWLDHVEEFEPDYVKVLVRDNPGFDGDDRRGQMDRLAVLSRTLREVHRTLIIELLVPATDEQKAKAGDRYDADLRPELTERVIRDMQSADVEPDIWKIEGLETADAARAVVATARAGDRGQVRCIVLGRDAPAERLDHWLTVAAGVDGFHGFAIGRSIWEQPLAGHLAGKLDAAQLTDQVATNYLHYAHVYRAAEEAARG
jgi:myo-inositol catabolism protein IolC